MIAATTAHLSASRYRQHFYQQLFCEGDVNVFSTLQTLFPAFVNVDPLLSIRSSLFSRKQGSIGVRALPKHLDRQQRYPHSIAPYVQCSQQNTNACTLFPTPTLCFHHFMNSFRKNTGGGRVQNATNKRCAQKDENII